MLHSESDYPALLDMVNRTTEDNRKDVGSSSLGGGLLPEGQLQVTQARAILT